MTRHTLSQLRTLFGFDLIELAKASQLEVPTIYKAMIRQPIGLNDAHQIMKGLQKLTGIMWTNHNVDIVLWEEQLVLWVARATITPIEVTEDNDEYAFVYARDKTHAHELLKRWREQLADSHPHGNTIPNPYGYKIGTLYVPGYLPAPEQEESSL